MWVQILLYNLKNKRTSQATMYNKSIIIMYVKNHIWDLKVKSTP